MRAVAAALCGILTACATAAVDAPPATSAITIGGATDDGTGFVDWHGATVSPPVVMGPQGGQHIWVSLRTGREFYANKMRILIDMMDLDTGEVVKPGQIPFTRNLTEDGNALAFSGLTAYVKEPCRIKGHRVRVHVSVEDLVGLTGSDEAIVTPTWSGYCVP